MDEQDNVWYRLGYTIAQARGKLPRAGSSPASVRTLAERETPRKVRAAQKPRPEPDPSERNSTPTHEEPVDNPLKRRSPTGEPWDAVIAAGATALIGHFVQGLPHKRKPGMMRLVRAGAAGAGAAIVSELIRSFRSGGIQKSELLTLAKDAALSGAARGLLYGTLLEPRIPGPPIVRGAAYGYIEHLVTPYGGLTNMLGAAAPHRSLPFIADLLDELDPAEETLAEHIIFGITMAALYGALPADPEEEDDDEDEEDEDEE